jgi:hypothetical protein
MEAADLDPHALDVDVQPVFQHREVHEVFRVLGRAEAVEGRAGGAAVARQDTGQVRGVPDVHG